MQQAASIAIQSFTPGASAASQAQANDINSWKTAEALAFASDAIIITDAAKRVLFLNIAAEQMFGYPAGEVVGLDLDILVPPRLQSPGALCLREPQNGHGPLKRTLDMIGRRQNGSTFSVEVSIGSVDASDGEMSIFVLRYISLRKETEAKFQRLMNSCAAASKSNELLLVELRHRMRNNLQAILSMIRLEKGRPISPEAKAELEQMESRIIALNGVDGELLVSSENKAVDLVDYVRRLAAALRKLFSTPLYLSVQMEPIEVTATAAARIGLLINEAITNSCKHAAPKGATEICLSMAKHDDIISIEIVDNGPGLPDNLCKHAGGMDLMQHLAQQMGGSVQFDSRSGLRCKIELPAAAKA